DGIPVSVKAIPRTEFESALQRLMGLDGDARRQCVLAKRDFDWEQFVSWLADRVREELQLDPLRSQDWAELAIAVAETINNRIALPRALRAKANALYTLDQHTAAIDLPRQAIAIFEAEGDEEELARTLSGSIQPQLLVGRYEDALAAAERARSLFTRQGN